jgi:hypothetical protein
LPHQFDAAIVRAPFRRVVGVDRPGSSVAGGCEASRIHAESIDERVFHGGGAPLRQIEIRRVASDVVGVTGDAQFPIRMPARDLADLLQCGLRFRPELVAVEAEMDGVDIRASRLGERAFERALYGSRATAGVRDLDDL